MIALTGEGCHGELGKLKSTYRIFAYVLEVSRLRHVMQLTASSTDPVGELQGAQEGICDVLQVGEHQTLKGFQNPLRF